MSQRRVLLLGPTGVDKAGAAAHLIEHAKNGLAHVIRYVDFENEFLKPALPGAKDWVTFLAQDIRLQNTIWQSAWDEFSDTLSDGVTVLGLHATYVSGQMGLRCAINIPALCDAFKPDLIISLIDDVYSMWLRTEARAAGHDRLGRPTFEQLLGARRSELILGDLITSHADNKACRHILCASGNAIETLVNLVLFDAPATYLSFPITATREMADQGDRSLIDVINEAHRLSALEMQRDRNRAFISPLAIDELPLLKAAKRSGLPLFDFVAGVDDNEGSRLVEFDYATDRWPVTDLWGDATQPILGQRDGAIQIPIGYIRDAAGLISTDVGWRDRRLVLQSNSLAIICPKPPIKKQISRGVQEEIDLAVRHGIACSYWQKPEWDVDNYLQTEVFRPAGSMGIGQTQANVEVVADLPALMKAKG